MALPACANESGIYGALCLAVARIEALCTLPFRRKGLGTIYAWTNRLLLPGTTWCQAEVFSGAWLRLPTFDPYWGPVAVGGRPYEPEIRKMLEGIGAWLSGRRWAFLDCGANFGYWSLFAASGAVRCPSVIAVEANPLTFQILDENARRNGNRIRRLQRAIAATSGARLQLSHVDLRAHANARVTVPATSCQEATCEVMTVTLDDVIRQELPPDCGPLVIKLDVEGKEAEALGGFREFRNIDHVILYEDHGSDPDCGATAAFLSEGYLIHHLSGDGRTSIIRSVEEAANHKPSRVRGYNFAASLPASAFTAWIQRRPRLAT